MMYFVLDSVILQGWRYMGAYFHKQFTLEESVLLTINYYAKKYLTGIRIFLLDLTQQILKLYLLRTVSEQNSYFHFNFNF